MGDIDCQCTAEYAMKVCLSKINITVDCTGVAVGYVSGSLLGRSLSVDRLESVQRSFVRSRGFRIVRPKIQCKIDTTTKTKYGSIRKS